MSSSHHEVSTFTQKLSSTSIIEPIDVLLPDPNQPISLSTSVITPTTSPTTSSDIRSKPIKNYTDCISTPTQIILAPIGIVYSPYYERFGCPRQPLAPSSLPPSAATSSSSTEASCDSRIELSLMESNARSLALRGLDGFDYIHVIYLCHLNTGWSPLIQPPRGPKKKQGVFATRSPHRPNSIGLSLIKIKKIDMLNGIIYFDSGDMLNGSPVVDIKPYIPQYDSPNDTMIRIGWLTGHDVINEPDNIRKSLREPSTVPSLSKLPLRINFASFPSHTVAAV